MTGPCGAGKTTLATRLIKERNLRLIEPEWFYHAFFGSDLVHREKDTVWEAISLAISVAEKEGVDILIDTTSPSKADREWFFKRFPSFEFHLIIVETPKEICLKNNRERERVIPDDDMEEVFSRIEPISDDEMTKYASIELYRNTDNTGVKFVEKIK